MIMISRHLDIRSPIMISLPPWPADYKSLYLSNHVYVMRLTRPQSSLKILEIELEKLLKNLKQKFKTNVKVKAIPRASEI